MLNIIFAQLFLYHWNETDVGTYTYFDIVLYFPNAW